MTREALTNEAKRDVAGTDRHHPVYPQGDQEFMLSLARGLEVVNAFSSENRSLTLAEASVLTGLPRAVVRRCLHTLTILGYVNFHERRFSLRPKILHLGHPYLAAAPLAAIAQPYLEKITAALNESCSLATLNGENITYIARCAAKFRIMSVDLQVGSELPAHCTSMGRILLANQPIEVQERLLRKAKLVANTRFTITDRVALLSILQRAKERGYCLLDQELELGLRSIAVPVRNANGTVVAALNVGVNAGRYSKQQLTAIALPVLKAIANEIGQLLL